MNAVVLIYMTKNDNPLPNSMTKLGQDEMKNYLVKIILHRNSIYIYYSVTDRGFTRRGVPKAGFGAKTYYLAKYLLKTA